MTTHLAIHDELINEALALGHFKTKEDTVTTALREFINRRKQSKLLACSDSSTPTRIMATRSGGILERVTWTNGAGDKSMVGDSKIGLIDPGLSTGANAQTSIVALKPDPTWLCPVCGLKRTIGSHKKCSKITQLKHRKERGEI